MDLVLQQGQSPPRIPICPKLWSPFRGTSRSHPCAAGSAPASYKYPRRQTTDLNAVFRVGLLLFTLLNIPCIYLWPVLTRGIPRHCRHCGVLLPSWGSGYLISPWVFLPNTFSEVGETWRETHCQVKVTHSRNHPPASLA